MDEATLQAAFAGRVEILTVDEGTARRGQTTVNFVTPWPVDRPYDGIPSRLTIDFRGRLDELALRPGPVPHENYDRKQVEWLLADAVEASDPPMRVETYAKDHHGILWRTHVDADGGTTASDAIDWIRRFLDAYRRLHDERREVPPERRPPACWDCEDAPISRVHTAKVMENVDMHIAVCEECAKEFGEMPFIYNSLDSDFTRKVGVQIETGEGTMMRGRF